MSEGITRDDWLKALTEAGANLEDDQDAVTVAEFMAMFDLVRYTAERRLRALAAAGKATVTRKRMTATDGRRVYCIAYRLIPAKKR